VDRRDLERLNRRHGTDFRAAGAYEGGEVGAVRLVDGAGRRFVFKRQPPGLGPRTTEALRAIGYPAPRYVACGDDYHVQEELPGAPVGGWGAGPPAVMKRLLELNELQAGRAVDDDGTWPQVVVDSVTLGFPEYAVVGTLERHSEESRALLELCRGVVGRWAGAIGERRDVVHWDYTLDNVLALGDRVTGIVDWGGTRSGDRLFDVATLVYYGRGEVPEVERYVVDRLGEEGLAVYLAHLAVRQSDWSLRHHGRDGDEVVRYSVDLLRVYSARPL
jgi:hypothetical protein